MQSFILVSPYSADTCQAGTNDFEKVLTCDGCMVGSDTSADTIWCVHENTDLVIPWSGCFSHSDGLFSAAGRSTPSFVEHLGVTETGDFLIPADLVNSLLNPEFNCSVAGDTGQMCYSEFQFIVFFIRKYIHVQWGSGVDSLAGQTITPPGSGKS